ncbi:MAG: HlyD family efflux transporter periplasmic adaptor subunit, partial [Microcoleus sp. SIO2G3]|nr:HlyD family efflux transporter periplasmic adaptor subunit [Microcoleus sp. SIO2G3]
MTVTTNGHNGQNGNGQRPIAPAPQSAAPEESKASRQAIRTEAFDQPVVLQQTALWSRAIVWGIVGVTAFGLIWASVAKIEEAVPATGKLEPQGQVQEVQAPTGGVVREILVRDGQRVKQGDVLVRFDATSALAQVQSLDKVRNSLTQENRLYQTLLRNGGTPSRADLAGLPPEVVALTTSRSTLVAENNLYRRQLGGADAGGLSAEESDRLGAIRSEANSRTSAAELEVSQLREQRDQAREQLATARQTLAINQRILDDIAPVVEEGAIARVQFLRQQTEVLNGQAEVDRLVKEQARLDYAMSQANQQLQNTRATTQTDLLGRIAENEKDIAEIDSQLNKALVENEKQLAEVNSQLSQAQVALRYQELRAPVDGVVFDVQPKGAGFVANTSEPVLKIVPSNALIAEVNITNQDIGFLHEGMDVDVRIDSFPFSEFGDVQGKLVSIGSDALPPTEVLPFYHFPAQIELDQQS